MYSTATGSPTAGSAAARRAGGSPPPPHPPPPPPPPPRARRSPPLRPYLLVELRRPAVVEQVGHEQFVDNEEQDDEAAGDQQLPESPGEQPPSVRPAAPAVLLHVRPSTDAARRRAVP